MWRTLSGVSVFLGGWGCWLLAKKDLGQPQVPVCWRGLSLDRQIFSVASQTTLPNVTVLETISETFSSGAAWRPPATHDHRILVLRLRPALDQPARPICTFCATCTLLLPPPLPGGSRWPAGLRPACKERCLSQPRSTFTRLRGGTFGDGWNSRRSGWGNQVREQFSGTGNGTVRGSLGHVAIWML